MTDLLSIDAGKIEIREPSGNLRFSTEEPMFHITDSASGSRSITFPFNPATNPFVRNTSYQLATGLNTAATTVLGVLQTTGDTYGRLPGGTWFDASGTYLHRFHWWTTNADGTFGEAQAIWHFAGYDFRVENGTLWLDERVRFAPYNTNGLQSLLPVSLSNFTITYKLKIGLFT